jgi:hypothetical protein
MRAMTPKRVPFMRVVNRLFSTPQPRDLMPAANDMMSVIPLTVLLTRLTNTCPESEKPVAAAKRCERRRLSWSGTHLSDLAAGYSFRVNAIQRSYLCK